MSQREVIFCVPGSNEQLVYERTDEGRLLRISGEGRVYVDATEEGRTVFDGGLVTSVQTELPGGLLRTMRALGRTWIESFAWDSKGLLTEIDGVKVSYDEQQRIVACSGAGGEWRYAYSGPYLAVIDSPHGLRQITHAEDGRPLSVRTTDHTAEIVYDPDGTRLPKPTSNPYWNRDASGRLWTVTDDAGHTVLTYIWDRYQCLGCIAGKVGQPLAAVYSLDLTGTPVRVITRDSIRQIPRDAFGESLLRERFVPGLFGGAVSDGLVYLPFRRLDPFTGSFDAPDPMLGQADDPRRADGYSGPLTVEMPASGPYTVCRNNPVTLSDPTGASSDYWWVILSSLTWSLQNTIASVVGAWLNLEMSPLGMIASKCMGGNIFDLEILTGHNVGALALRSDGWLARVTGDNGRQPTRTWTFQYLVNAPSKNFTVFEEARLFAPSARFQPKLYGTVLLCDPHDKPPFILRGQRTTPNDATLLNWSRHGGPAEPVIPGSLVPVFPSGGLHFDKVQTEVYEQAADVVELEPTQGVFSGTMSQRALLRVNGLSLGLATNGFVVLTSNSGTVEATRILSVHEESGKTLVRVETAGATLGNDNIRLQGLSALVGTESLTPIAGQTQKLSLAGSSNNYRPNSSVIRLNRASVALGSAKVTALEAQIALDASVPATLGNRLNVRPAVASGNFNATLTANANVLHIDTGTVPGEGTGIVVGAAANAIPTMVRTVAGRDVTVDRSLSALGADRTAVPWQNLAPLPPIGTRSAAPEPEARITYAPVTAGTAPATGFVWIEGSSIATRRVTALTYDAIVLNQALPDTLATPFDVDRFTVQAPDVRGVTRTTAQALALNAAPPTTAKAFHVIELSGPALAASTAIFTGATLAGDTARVDVDPVSATSGLVPGEIVVLQSGTLEAAVVSRLRLTFTLSRALPLSNNPLEAVRLQASGPEYAGIRRADRTFRVLPSVLVGTTATVTDLPRFSIGELVRVVLKSSFTFTPEAALTFGLGNTISIIITNAAGNNIDYRFEVSDGSTPLITTSTTTNAPNAAAGIIAIAVVSDPLLATTQQTIAAIVAAMQANGFLVTTNTDGGFEVNSNSPIVSTPTVSGGAGSRLAISPSERLYRVDNVIAGGSTITGSADEAIIPPSVTNLTVRRLTVEDPRTGSSRVGINGAQLPNAQVRFECWTPDAFDFTRRRIAIIDGANVFAVRVGLDKQSLEIVFLAAPSLPSPVSLSVPTQAPPTGTTSGSGFSSRFTLDGASIVFLDQPLTSALSGLILAVPYIETTRRVSGRVKSGNVRVPEDHERETKENNRRQALTDHELVHTQQCAQLGPWLLAYSPLFLLELLGEFATSAGMPEFGRYVPATIATNSITIPAVGGVTIEAEDHVQVAQNGRAETIELGTKTGDVFTVSAGERQKLTAKGMVNGPAQARRVETGGVEAMEFFVNALQIFTVGGLMNQLTIAGWGGTIFGITMLIQAIRGWTRNTVTAQLAADHVTLTLRAGERVDGLAVGSLLALEKDNQTFVRPVRSITARTIVLETAAPLEGEVRISAYSACSAMFPFMHKYFPATFPDPNRPASLQVQPVGSETLSLAVNDRVYIRSSRGHDFNTRVTAISGNLIEVEEDSLVTPGETVEFFIAKIGEDDPMGFADQFLLDKLHIGWMQYVHDPWGQIVYRARPTGTVSQILARSARYLFSTQGWSLLPALGRYFWDNLFNTCAVTGPTGRLDTGSQRSHMEQEASRRSGDCYCPIGTLHGELTFVGDIARYWLTEHGGVLDFEEPEDMIDLGKQDGPGTHKHQYVSVTPTTTGGLPDGAFVAAAFFEIDAGLGLSGVGDRGWIPVNNTLEASSGAYVAFTRPGSHTITAASNLIGFEKAEDAHAHGFPNIIRHERTIRDVTVTLASLPVADSSATPTDLIPFQRALFAVIPNGPRVHRASLVEPGAIATIENNLELVMRGIAPAAAPGGLVTENVEISRFYHFNGTSFGAGVGPVNLPTDLDVAVRRLQIRLVDTLPLRATNNPSNGAIATILPGVTGVLLIPAPFSIPAITTAVTGTPSLRPRFTPPTGALPANTRDFVRDGNVVNMVIPNNEPPEAAAQLTITIPVGPAGGATVPVTCRVTVNPHFTLDSPGGGFTLTAAASLTLRSSDGRNIALVGTLTGIDVTVNNNELVLARRTAAPGPVVILVADAANNQIMARRTITVA
jgi:hypothetical protein